MTIFEKQDYPAVRGVRVPIDMLNRGTSCPFDPQGKRVRITVATTATRRKLPSRFRCESKLVQVPIFRPEWRELDALATF